MSHVAKWTLSSHKYGFGVENLRDDNENTFWQYVPPSISREILITGQKELNHILLTSDSLNVFSSLYVPLIGRELMIGCGYTYKSSQG